MHLENIIVLHANYNNYLHEMFYQGTLKKTGFQGTIMSNILKQIQMSL